MIHENKNNKFCILNETQSLLFLIKRLFENIRKCDNYLLYDLIHTNFNKFKFNKK